MNGKKITKSLYAWIACVMFALPLSLKNESAIASFALARYSLSGYVLISVCRFNRPTSCRPCLTSSIALLYRILSGSAVFSALVDLFTFFFLWKICASHVVALSRNSPPAATIASHFALTPTKVKRKLSPLSLVWDSFPQIAQAHVLSGSPQIGRLQYTLNEGPG